MRHLLLLTAILALLCIVSSCNDGKAKAAQIGSDFDKQTFIANFCETDFTPVIETADVKFIEDFPEGEERWNFIDFMESGGVDTEVELTADEQLVLSTIRVGPSKVDFTSTGRKIYSYYSKTGSWPSSPEEMLDYYWDDEAVQIVDAAGLEQQFMYVKDLVNPATGRLYENLNATEWEPLGCYVEIVPQEEREAAVGSSELPDPVELEGTEYQPQTLFRFVRWGETEGKVLQNLYMWSA